MSFSVISKWIVDAARWRAPLGKEIYALILLGAVVFYWAAIISFSPWDPSGFAVSTPPRSVDNLGGRIGAAMGAWLFFHVGILSYLAPLPLAWSLFRVLKKDDTLFKSLRVWGWAAIFVSGAALSHAFLGPLTLEQVSILPAGGLGAWLFDSFHGQLGAVGYPTAAVVLQLMGIAVVFDFSHGTFLRSLWLRVGGNRKESTGSGGSRWRAWFRRPVPVVARPEPDAAVDAAEQVSMARLLAFPNAGRVPAVDDSEDPVFDTAVPFHAAGLGGPESPVSHRSPSPLKVMPGPPAVSARSSRDYREGIDLSMFKNASPSAGADSKELNATAALIGQVFAEFGVNGQIVGFQPGPVVTVYEFQPDPGIKQSRIMTLIDDIALALRVDSIFIFPVKGKRALGVQVPNRARQMSYIRDILESQAFRDSNSPLTIAMGLSISGEPVCADLRAMPHLLMAGATGAGKSVAINAMLASVIAKSDPDSVKMILVDPKMLELSVYEGIPHLLMPVITDADRAATALKWAVSEMERRYRIMQQLSVRNIASFNEVWETLPDAERDRLRHEAGDPKLNGLPIILLVIDELADLMLTAPKEVENCIQRLAQKARASGIHMILATQRPSVDIITGVIKANLPCRIAFQVVSRHDSRTILDQMGAEKLLGKGDLLFMRPGTQRLERIQGAMVEDNEIIAFVSQFKVAGDKAYSEDVIDWIEQEMVKDADPADVEGELAGDGDDPKYDEAIAIAQSQGAISASFLQRRLKIGYNRAARIVERMESLGLVEKGSGSKPRTWLGR